MGKQSENFKALRNQKPLEFWNYFKSKKNSVQSVLTIDEFKTHFSSILNDIKTVSLEEVESLNDNFNMSANTFSQLNDPFLYAEVESAIKKLNRNKAVCPVDDIINEYILESRDILCGHITSLFNRVFDSWFFPETWARGYIIPLHKKGDINMTTNYRGITFLSNLGKLFASVLDSRIERWYKENGILSDAQFGFRRARSAVDSIFVLHQLIEQFICSKRRLFCVFIDLKKAFDSVYRNALWYKLYNMGFDGKILNIFKSMYSHVKSCIKLHTNVSDFFEISVGLFQGHNNSPALFALFLDDLELYLQDRVNCRINLYELCIILLLFADDMVLIGNSPQDLQHSLNKLFDYCTKWGLEVNTDKTNVVVFRKRGPVFENEKWYYNNEELVIKDNFNYLGVTFNYTGSFVLNNQCLKGKSLRAMYTLINNIKKHQVKPDVALSLFDSFVAPILNYASPIWGFHKSK